MEKKSKILNVIKIVYLSIICLFIINFILVLILQKNWLLYTSIGLLMLVIVLYITIHIVHAKNYIYKCPKCGEEFKISFIKDITSYNAGVERKVLICSKCNTKEVMQGKIK